MILPTAAINKMSLDSETRKSYENDFSFFIPIASDEPDVTQVATPSIGNWIKRPMNIDFKHSSKKSKSIKLHLKTQTFKINCVVVPNTLYLIPWL